MILDARAEVAIRPVTDAEVAFFEEHGWVTLHELVPREACSAMLEAAQRLMGPAGNANDAGIEHTWFQDFQRPRDEQEAFASLTADAGLGQNAARLLGRDTAIRLLSDMLAVKLPLRSHGERGQPTDPHQDYGSIPYDRGSLGIAIALDDVSPEQGPLVFFSGSHRMGPLGRFGTPDVVGKWPRLGKCPVSEPEHLRPGDATVHHSLTVHAAAANTGTGPRWQYLLHCFPADALYTNKPSRSTDGLGLLPGEPLDHPRFPVIYDPKEHNPSGA